MEKTNREIAEELGKTVAELKELRTKAKNEQKALRRSQVLELKKHGWSNVGIARILNISEWTVKSILDL